MDSKELKTYFNLSHNNLEVIFSASIGARSLSTLVFL